MQYSSQKDFNAYIKRLIDSGVWRFERKAHRKHAYLVHRATGYKQTLPTSPKGDRAALLNFKSQIRKAERHVSRDV